MLAGAVQRRMGNEFALVWQVAGNVAEAVGFRLAVVLSGACPSSFLSFLCGEADSLWLLGCFWLCVLGRRGFEVLGARAGVAFGFAGFLLLGLGSGLSS